MNSILFLDFDGVLNSHSGLIKRGYDTDINYKVFEEHVEVFNWLCNEMMNNEDVEDFSIVITSTWRKRKSLEEIREILHNTGFKYPELITDKTVSFRDATRGDEIDEYLKTVGFHMNMAEKDKGKEEELRFAILDDKVPSEVYRRDPRFIFVSSSYGLDYYDALVAVKVMTGEVVEDGSPKMPLVMF